MRRITPGIYVEETPGRVPTISGLATSVTAFIGRSPHGPSHEPIQVQSFGEYTRRFGELSRASPMSYAVFHFFQAGGTDALIVRVTPLQDAPHTQPAATSLNSAGDDDGPISGMDIGLGATLESAHKGLWALEKAEHFNLMCIPPYSFDDDDDVEAATWQAARTYCRSRRAMLIMDSPSHWNNHSDAVHGVDDLRGAFDDHAALYFPRIRMPDPLEGGRMVTFAPGGMIAGIYVRTDSQQGVWKAPAGTEARLDAAAELTCEIDDLANGELNPLGINCLRTIPTVGRVIWGARTLAGADLLGSEWKYLPVRRLALHIEGSLYRGLEWVVFEPNDETLWVKIRHDVGTFLHDLFRRGAFQGSSPRDAYFVKCDGETTTPSDRENGHVNVLIGFAPLKPAEFVTIKITHKAGGRPA